MYLCGEQVFALQEVFYQTNQWQCWSRPFLFKGIFKHSLFQACGQLNLLTLTTILKTEPRSAGVQFSAFFGLYTFELNGAAISPFNKAAQSPEPDRRGFSSRTKSHLFEGV